MKLKLLLLLLPVVFGACAVVPAGPVVLGAESELALLRRLVEDTHGRRDAAALGALHADTAVYEWRGRGVPLTGRADLVRHLGEVWANRRELRLNLQASELRIHDDRAYEFGSYEETWIDPTDTRVTEFGRYVTAYAREADGQWRIARTVGFANLVAARAVAD
ncbi:MAG: nuclear transport factor 2 family protein [Opitutaceae bacterium]|nr:nuclear transport factor 2 family protein [Opitutaceae bacterium]